MYGRAEGRSVPPKNLLCRIRKKNDTNPYLYQKLNAQ